MNKKLNTTYDFIFYDGSTATLTLTFYAVYQLKSKNKSLYDRYNKIMNNMKDADELDMITILYAAYVCANGSEGMTEEEFMIKCGSDRKAVSEAVKALVNPK